MYLTSRRTEVCVILQNAGDTEEIQANFESTAIVYFNGHPMSCTVTLLIASVIQRKADRPYINPVILIYLAKI